MLIKFVTAIVAGKEIKIVATV